MASCQEMINPYERDAQCVNLYHRIGTLQAAIRFSQTDFDLLTTSFNTFQTEHREVSKWDRQITGCREWHYLTSGSSVPTKAIISISIHIAPLQTIDLGNALRWAMSEILSGRLLLRVGRTDSTDIKRILILPRLPFHGPHSGEGNHFTLQILLKCREETPPMQSQSSHCHESGNCL
jgi:hypothetical protein